MRWLEKLRMRSQMLFHRQREAHRLDAELAFHLEQQIAENIAAGMSHDEAGYAARRTFGNTMLLREQASDTWGWNHTGVFNRRPSRGDARFQMLEDPWTRHTRVLADEDFPRHLLSDGLADRL